MIIKCQFTEDPDTDENYRCVEYNEYWPSLNRCYMTDTQTRNWAKPAPRTKFGIRQQLPSTQPAGLMSPIEFEQEYAQICE